MFTSSLTMVTTFPFDDTNDLMNFLFYHSIIGTWETQIARLSAVHGMSMDLTTKKTNYKGETTYLQFNNIKSIIKNFMENNSYMNINVEIKLRYPDIQRHIMDINDNYQFFWLNCYSDPVNITHYAAISYLENNKELAVDPLTSWAVYVHSLYNDYINSKQ